jgi:uncharacterized protein (TIGR01777 family)
MKHERIILPGGSGFLGSILAPHLQHSGYEVTVLTRTPECHLPGVRTARWDSITLGAWVGELEGAAAVINLAGRSVNCRYNARNRRLMMESRVKSTQILGQAIAQCKSPPPVWVNSSTATIYQHSYERAMDEATGRIQATAQARDAFSIDVATAWEKALAESNVPGTRRVAIRTAMVLSNTGSVFEVLRRLVRFGLGGRMGSGRQYVSWIHESDFCRAVEWILTHDDLAGPINVTAPNPLPNEDMMRILRRVMGVPIGLPASAWMLEVGAFLLRTETELIIKSRRVVPERLLSGGFQFQYEEFQSAAQALVAATAPAAATAAAVGPAL